MRNDSLSPKASPKKSGLKWKAIVPLLFIVSLIGVMVASRDQAKAPSASAVLKTSGSSASSASSTASPAFDNRQFSVDKPDSLWVVVDKRRPLDPKNYAPALTTPNIPLRLSKGTSEMQVSSQMAPALEKLVGAAADAKVPLMLASGYRSYQEQISVYGSEVKAYGVQKADRESARPGFSEHQTGLAADLEPVSRTCEVAQCFGQLAEGQWLAANAATYGFIIRYPENKEAITGYIYEPWHVRYVGIPLARQLQIHSDETLETFFKLQAAPDYL